MKKETKREKIERFAKMFWADMPEPQKYIYATDPCIAAILGAAGFRAFDRHVADTGSLYIWARDGQGRSIELRDSNHWNWNQKPDGHNSYTLNVRGHGALRWLLVYLGWKGQGKETFANVLSIIEWNRKDALPSRAC